MSTLIQAGAEGIALRVTVKDENGVIIALNGATIKDIILQTPVKDLITAPMDFVTDGTDGLLEYLTTGVDIAEAGTYHAQVHLAFANVDARTSRMTFKVLANLE